MDGDSAAPDDDSADDGDPVGDDDSASGPEFPGTGNEAHWIHRVQVTGPDPGGADSFVLTDMLDYCAFAQSSLQAHWNATRLHTWALQDLVEEYSGVPAYWDDPEYVAAQCVIERDFYATIAEIYAPLFEGQHVVTRITFLAGEAAYWTLPTEGTHESNGPDPNYGYYDGEFTVNLVEYGENWLAGQAASFECEDPTWTLEQWLFGAWTDALPLPWVETGGTVDVTALGDAWTLAFAGLLLSPNEDGGLDYPEPSVEGTVSLTISHTYPLCEVPVYDPEEP
jgi:hypothetical protein